MKRPRRRSQQRRRLQRYPAQFYRPQLRQLARPWLLPVVALTIVILGGAIGYRITEGWDWGDCLWMVLITISTIGYGEVEPLSQAGRLVTVLIVAGGIVVVQLSIQKILGLTESGYFRQLRELRFRIACCGVMNMTTSSSAATAASAGRSPTSCSWRQRSRARCD